MKLSTLNTFPAVLALALVLLTGCEVPTSGLTDSESAAAVDDASFASADLATTLTQELNLNETQQIALSGDLDRQGNPDVHPGGLWYVAARLQGYLSEEQMDRLFTLAGRLDDRQMHKLVGVYGPCLIERPEEDRRLRVRLIADLLSDEQEEAMEVIRARYGAEIRALHDQVSAGTLTRKEAADQIRDLHEAAEAEIRALLSDDQLAALQDRLDARGENAEAHLAAAKEAMIDALGLDEAQVAELDELQRTQCATLDELIRSVHAEEITREAFHEAIARLVGVKLEAYERILDAEQFTSARIHDALLIVNARRYVNGVAGGPTRGANRGPNARPMGGPHGGPNGGVHGSPLGGPQGGPMNGTQPGHRGGGFGGGFGSPMGGGPFGGAAGGAVGHMPGSSFDPPYSGSGSSTE